MSPATMICHLPSAICHPPQAPPSPLNGKKAGLRGENDTAAPVAHRSGFRLLAFTCFLLLISTLHAADYLSPSDLAASRDGNTVFVACATADRVLAFDLATGKVARSIKAGSAPGGLAINRDGSRLYITGGGPNGYVDVVEAASGKRLQRIPCGHTPGAPVLSPDGSTLFVCNRFNDQVLAIDLATGNKRSVQVPREPIGAAITPDGKLLFVANHLHAGRADADVVAASITVIDAATLKVVKDIRLVNGSSLLRDVAVSPDGKHVVVAHQISRFHLPTTQIERGWINTSGFTLIDVASLKTINTVLLDNIDSGAATPWGVAWSDDGKRIVISHAGTHEVSVVDAPALLAKLATMPEKLPAGAKVDYTVASHVAGDVPNDLSFLVGLRDRVRLPKSDRGPRAVILACNRVVTANYFSDTLSSFEIGDRPAPGRSFSSGGCASPASLPLGPAVQMSIERKGEFYFNDASICFQGWQSCASCHSSDARVDGLNWDNLNDGIGNPKNAKSLLQAYSTSPSMWLSVREDAATAVRAGIKHSLFTVQAPEVAAALDAYLKSLKPILSPRLVNGKLSPAAERGRRLFEDETVACMDCHKGKFFTDLKPHDVGTRSEFDKPADIFDTPSLIETWRTGPYLHDGSAVTIRDVLVGRNPNNEHGNIKKLTPVQVEDLIEYVLSL